VLRGAERRAARARSAVQAVRDAFKERRALEGPALSLAMDVVGPASLLRDPSSPRPRPARPRRRTSLPRAPRRAAADRARAPRQMMATVRVIEENIALGLQVPPIVAPPPPPFPVLIGHVSSLSPN
jgi:hypothetical protein